MVKVLKLPLTRIQNEVAAGNIRFTIVGVTPYTLSLAALFLEKGCQVTVCDANERILQVIEEGMSPYLERDVTPLMMRRAGRLFKREVVMPFLPHLCPFCGSPFIPDREKRAICSGCGKVGIRTPYGIVTPRRVGYSKTPFGRVGQLGLIIRTARKAVWRPRRARRQARELPEERQLTVKTDVQRAVRRADVILLHADVGITKGDFDTTPLAEAARPVAKGLTRGHLIIFTSAVPPGTTEGVLKLVLEQESGFEEGEDFGLAYLPLLHATGNLITQLKYGVKLVASPDPLSIRAVKGLFAAWPGEVIEVPQVKVLEAAKLFQAAYRMVEIGIANEFARIAEAAGVDYDMIRDILTTVDPRIHLLPPGPAAGESLLHESSMFVTLSTRSGVTPHYLHRSFDINEQFVEELVATMERLAERHGIALTGQRTAILGVAYKGNITEFQNSPAIPLINLLITRGVKVAVHDPYVSFQELSLAIPPGTTMTRDLAEALRRAVCVVVLADHITYRTLKPADLLGMTGQSKVLVIDVRRVFDAKEAREAGLIYYGFGFPMR
ncbi:hypothetical protein DRN94_004275 [archaeon]|nr:hypothetical protein [archaeon]